MCSLSVLLIWWLLMHYCFHLVALIEGEYFTLMKKSSNSLGGWGNIIGALVQYNLQ